MFQRLQGPIRLCRVTIVTGRGTKRGESASTSEKCIFIYLVVRHHRCAVCGSSLHLRPPPLHNSSSPLPPRCRSARCQI
eukprot:6572436-Pyramimonas_sp.AAC.1